MRKEKADPGLLKDFYIITSRLSSLKNGNINKCVYKTKERRFFKPKTNYILNYDFLEPLPTCLSFAQAVIYVTFFPVSHNSKTLLY